MLAGYESTSYALGYCFYVLATMPQEQQKLIEEIRDTYFKKPNVNLYFLLKYCLNSFLFVFYY